MFKCSLRQHHITRDEHGLELGWIRAIPILWILIESGV